MFGQAPLGRRGIEPRAAVCGVKAATAAEVLHTGVVLERDVSYAEPGLLSQGNFCDRFHSQSSWS